MLWSEVEDQSAIFGAFLHTFALILKCFLDSFKAELADLCKFEQDILVSFWDDRSELSTFSQRRDRFSVR